MLTLSLLRHGKSSWDDPQCEDHEPPLAERGRRAAPAMGAYMARRGLKPDLVLCSNASRAQQTLELILPHLGLPAPRTATEPSLYMAKPSLMLDVVRRTAPEVRHVMVIGHNPGIHGLALDLSGTGTRRDIASMALKFPTCALAVLTFDAENWRDIRPASGRLILFQQPRSLA